MCGGKGNDQKSGMNNKNRNDVFFVDRSDKGGEDFMMMNWRSEAGDQKEAIFLF